MTTINKFFQKRNIVIYCIVLLGNSILFFLGNKGISLTPTDDKFNIFYLIFHLLAAPIAIFAALFNILPSLLFKQNEASFELISLILSSVFYTGLIIFAIFLFSLIKRSLETGHS